MSDVTQLIADIAGGRAQAAEELLPLVYEELRRLAESHLAREKPGQTLQATALVHEAYLRLAGNAAGFEGRRHFFNAAAEAMRRILVDNSRRKKAERHGGGVQKIQCDEAIDAIAPPSAHVQAAEDIVDVHDALEKLAREDPESAELVKLHYFAGLTLDEIAELLGIHPRTAERNWAYARAWLCRSLGAYDGAKP